MGKAALQADLNRCLGQLSEVNGKLGKLRALTFTLTNAKNPSLS